MEVKINSQEVNNDQILLKKIQELDMEIAEKDKRLNKESESSVRKRILELEICLDEQSNKYMELLKEKSDLKEQMIKLTRDRERLIDSYEHQVDEMEKALKDKIFAEEDSRHLDEINSLKLRYENDQREILDLKMRQVIYKLKLDWRLVKKPAHLFMIRPLLY